MFISQRSHLATTLFATIVTALVLTAQPGQARDEVAPVAVRNAPVVHQLPRVVVTGRVQGTAPRDVVELPRVVVTGKRVDVLPTVLVQAPVRGGERS